MNILCFVTCNLKKKIKLFHHCYGTVFDGSTSCQVNGTEQAGMQSQSQLD